MQGFTTTAIASRDYKDVVTRECGEGFGFNLGFVQHIPQRKITRYYYDPLTGEQTGSESFIEPCDTGG